MGNFKTWLTLQENTEGVIRAYSNSSYQPTDTAATIQQNQEEMKQLARELVFAFQDAEDQADRDAILQHMKKLPFSLIGKVGEVVGFDGRNMTTEDMPEVGDPVQVVTPGFQLTWEGSPYPWLIGRAAVRAAQPGTPAGGKLTILPWGTRVTVESPEAAMLKRKIAETEQKIRNEKDPSRKAALQRMLASYQKQ